MKRVNSRQSTVDSFFERHLPTYVDHLAVERGLSSASLKAYRSDLSDFGRWLAKSNLSASRLRRDDLSRYLKSLKLRGLSSRSTSRALSALRGFYAFAGVHLGFAQDPTSDLVSPRAGLSLPKPLSEAEVEALLEAPDGGRPLGLRDRAMLELTYASGLRVSEVVSLPRDRVDVESGILRAPARAGASASSRSESPPASGWRSTSNACARSSTAGVPSLFLTPAAGP